LTTGGKKRELTISLTPGKWGKRRKKGKIPLSKNKENCCGCNLREEVPSGQDASRGRESIQKAETPMGDLKKRIKGVVDQVGWRNGTSLVRKRDRQWVGE